MILQNKKLNRVSIFVLIIVSICQINFAQEMTAEKIIEKNMEVCGGAEAWAKINSIKMTGTYVNFSIPEDFAIYRMRENDLYRFDTRRIHRPSIHVFDGEKAWWINPVFDPKFSEPTVIPTNGNLAKVTLRERFFEPVYWNFEQKGNNVELLGTEEIDGEKTYKMKVVLKDGDEEIWYFSADTFHAVYMTGTTYDFGYPNKLKMFFSDYRKIGDVVMPYLVESEYGIRYRSLEVKEIVLNKDVDKELFKLKK